jgi:hypothetical protein
MYIFLKSGKERIEQMPCSYFDEMTAHYITNDSKCDEYYYNCALVLVSTVKTVYMLKDS